MYTTSPSVLVMIDAELSRLPDALRSVGKAVLNDPLATATMSMNALALRSHTTPETVARFCRALGLAGFQDLRVRLAREAKHTGTDSWPDDIGFDVSPDDSLAHIAAVVARADVLSLQDTADQLDLSALDAAARALAVAGRIDVYALGGSAYAAQEMESRMHRIGRPIWARTEAQQAQTSAALLTPVDAAIALSHSGTTGQTIAALCLAGSAGATTIAITDNPHSPLAGYADHILTTAVHGTTYRHGGPAARHAQLLILDTLYVRVAQLTHEHASACLEKTRHIPEHHRGT
ncbi:RpiR family transcriptional regulator [Longispora fulva]|uniref:DNA-binding MurR/RpiR family transcriptional regulator n=1 Tax=Longispora fulva TaxID=619741 RepID=A0A8J7KV45_9ACTN|nr:MurR/RpiR family transcriptional regulator [Longispora fulva]MBG6134822.1 DNA-binding MurR/RpiR family transcriptional regulator [Longispora fulva]GIG56946.1 RpiR family transcriptional regulator [Longispora fulva]